MIYTELLEELNVLIFMASSYIEQHRRIYTPNKTFEQCLEERTKEFNNVIDYFEKLSLGVLYYDYNIENSMRAIRVID